MKDIIQAKICEGLEHFSNPSGVGFLDKFTPLDLGECSNNISHHIPLYSEEISNIIINYVLEFLETKERKIKFVKKCISHYTSLYIKGNESSEVLTTLTSYYNILNVLVNDIEIHKEEENFKNFMISFLMTSMEQVQEQIKEDNTPATTINIGDYFIRLVDDEFDLGFVPTKLTKENFKNYLL